MGGIQNCIVIEERAFVERGWFYLHLSPQQPLPMLAEPNSKVVVKLRLNGRELGRSKLEELTKPLQLVQGLPRYAVVHHLLGYAPECLIELLKNFAPNQTLVWIHDYFTVCPSYNLLRNDVAFCGAPNPDSTACTICSYGSEREAHLTRVTKFFEGVNPIVFCPSDSTSSFWDSVFSGGYAERLTVPHGRLLMFGDEVDDEERTVGDPIRIGFVGAPLYHKGWFVFEALATRHFGDSRYQFFHLSTEIASLCRNISHVPARVTVEVPHAMSEIVAANKLDVVVSWSLWPETFCFTVHEALAGGAFIVARRAAGNTWPAVAHLDPARGCALDDENDLFSLFETGKLLHLLPRKKRGYFQHLSGTAVYVFERHEIQQAIEYE